jgi:transposase-like protein
MATMGPKKRTQNRPGEAEAARRCSPEVKLRLIQELNAGTPMTEVCRAFGVP